MSCIVMAHIFRAHMVMALYSVCRFDEEWVEGFELAEIPERAVLRIGEANVFFRKNDGL